MVVEGEVVGVDVTDIPIHSTHQSDMFGNDDWVYDNGSFYTGVGKGVALHGVFKSINDNKGPSGQEEPCIQVRAWYSSNRGLSSNETGSYAKAKSPAESAFQKPFF